MELELLVNIEGTRSSLLGESSGRPTVSRVATANGKLNRPVQASLPGNEMSMSSVIEPLIEHDSPVQCAAGSDTGGADARNSSVAVVIGRLEPCKLVKALWGAPFLPTLATSFSEEETEAFQFERRCNRLPFPAWLGRVQYSPLPWLIEQSRLELCLIEYLWQN
ncbi:hypothetical protein VTN77DRAFT_1418 [Rasamsonia byssochlamydoides]|uniref:uncharacterized protein n=1 Tax=Rasamsonia byssochlamydoides TaxID=89139 RepID=UPI003743E689